MGLLDEILSQLAAGTDVGNPGGRPPQGDRPRPGTQASTGGPDLLALAQTVMAMLGDQRQGGFGGLQGMVEAFQRNGLGDVIASWVGTGANQPISPGQLRDALGGERVTRVAEQAGIAPDQSLGALAALLPQLIDRLTPDGQVPGRQDDLMAMGLEILRGSGRRTTP